MAKVASLEGTPVEPIREAFAALGGTQKSGAISNWINSQYPGKWTHGEVGSFLRRCSVNLSGPIRRHPGFPHFLYCAGRAEFTLYDAGKHGSWDESGHLEGESSDDAETLEERLELNDELDEKILFDAESKLRDYLAKNLQKLEDGLVLFTGNETTSVEYSVEGKRIDILAKDKAGIPVIIELKLRRGHEKTIGQALYYRGKLKQLLKVDRVRIILLASEISDELTIASSEVGDVDLFDYELSMNIRKLGQ